MDDETLARQVNEPEGEERSSSPLRNEAHNEDTAAANAVITTGLQAEEPVQSPSASNNSDSAFDVSPDLQAEGSQASGGNIREFHHMHIHHFHDDPHVYNHLATLDPPAYGDSASGPLTSSPSGTSPDWVETEDPPPYSVSPQDPPTTQAQRQQSLARSSLEVWSSESDGHQYQLTHDLVDYNLQQIREDWDPAHYLYQVLHEQVDDRIRNQLRDHSNLTAEERSNIIHGVVSDYRSTRDRWVVEPVPDLVSPSQSPTPPPPQSSTSAPRSTASRSRLGRNSRVGTTSRSATATQPSTAARSPTSARSSTATRSSTRSATATQPSTAARSPTSARSSTATRSSARSATVTQPSSAARSPTRRSSTAARSSTVTRSSTTTWSSTATRSPTTVQATTTRSSSAARPSTPSQPATSSPVTPGLPQYDEALASSHGQASEGPIWDRVHTHEDRLTTLERDVDRAHHRLQTSEQAAERLERLSRQRDRRQRQERQELENRLAAVPLTARQLPEGSSLSPFEWEQRQAERERREVAGAEAVGRAGAAAVRRSTQWRTIRSHRTRNAGRWFDLPDNETPSFPDPEVCRQILRRDAEEEAASASF